MCGYKQCLRTVIFIIGFTPKYNLGPSINVILFSNTFIGVKRSGIMKMIEPCKKTFY